MLPTVQSGLLYQVVHRNQVDTSNYHEVCAVFVCKHLHVAQNYNVLSLVVQIV